jgi:hypothetical protein
MVRRWRGMTRDGGERRQRQRRTAPPAAPPPPARPDDDTEHCGTHPHAYEQLLVGWMTGAACYGGRWERGGEDDHRRTTRHPPHAYELMLVGWIVGATDVPPAPSLTSHCSWGGSRAEGCQRLGRETAGRGNDEGQELLFPLVSSSIKYIFCIYKSSVRDRLGPVSSGPATHQEMSGPWTGLIP